MALRTSATLPQVVAIPHHLNAIEEATGYARQLGTQSVRFLLFVPRGRGRLNQREFLLTPEQARAAERKIEAARVEAVEVGLLLHYSNYFRKGYVVLEPSGRLQTEGAFAEGDRELLDFDSIPVALAK